MKNYSKNLLALFSLFFLFTTSYAVTLKSGMTVPVKLSQNINANMDAAGKTIYFTVVEDVLVDNVIVIREGEFVKGFISQAEGRKSLGKGGKLTVTPKSMQTSNGEIVKFEQNSLSAEGKKRTGATVAHVVMWGPLGLFAKGRAAFIMRDTEYDLVIDNDVKLKKAKKSNKNPSENRTSIDTFFKDYSKKINYRKGKDGKDFVLYVPKNQLDNESLKASDVKIYSVNEDMMPKSIKAKAIELDYKNDRYELTYDFHSLIGYILPGSVEIGITIGDTYKSETRLSTEWKMK